MPDKRRLLHERIDQYISLLRKEKRSERTLKTYKYEIERAFNALEEASLEISPKKVGAKEIDYLRETVFTEGEMYNRYRLAIVGTFLKWCGNNIVEQMKIGWPNDMRIGANWLEPDEAMIIRNMAEGKTRLIVHLELDLCLRRIEVLRLKVNDFIGDRVHVLGKGKMGGKHRTIPFHPETREILGQWLKLRSEIVEKAKKRNPNVRVPEELFIYERKGKLGAYKKTSIDNFLKKLKDQAETAYHQKFNFSNHTLRRTGGRMMWLAGVKIETISTILGHEDIATTIDYLGIKLDDMSEGMKMLAQYQNAVICPRNGILMS